jgi:predicted nucleic acid-binding protein
LDVCFRGDLGREQILHIAKEERRILLTQEEHLLESQEIDRVIEALPIELVDVDLNLARQAGKFKAFKKMSFADCFAAALAKSRKAQLITGDREFKAVEDEINILWI